MDRELLVAGGDSARFLERADGALDGAAPTLGRPVEVRLPPGPVGPLPLLIGALRDHRPHAVAPQPAADRRVAVALVAGERGGASPRAPRPAARDNHGVQHARACTLSCAWPALRATARGSPWPSVTRCSLVVNPPRLRPRAWSAGSPGGWFFPRARGDAMRPDVAAVDAPELPVDPAGLGQLVLEHGEDAVPQPLTRPPALA